MPITDEQTAVLVQFGVSKINLLNNVMCEDEALRELDDRKLTVVTICYAASLAKLTKLNLHDFLSLAVSAYQNVEISKTKTETAEEKLDG